MKNEHIIWAYAERESGGHVLIIGITNVGLNYLRAGEGKDKKTLTFSPPSGKFVDVREVIVYNEKDKATLKETLRGAGIPISEVN